MIAKLSIRTRDRGTILNLSVVERARFHCTHGLSYQWPMLEFYHQFPALAHGHGATYVARGNEDGTRARCYIVIFKNGQHNISGPNTCRGSGL